MRWIKFLFLLLATEAFSNSYPNNLKNQHLDCAKAPGLSDLKSPHISNIGQLKIAQPRELSRGPNADFSGCLGISPSFHLICLADQSPLTGVLCSVYGTQHYVGIDAGAPFYEKDEQIEAYLISHPHLHRLTSLMINSPGQKRKNLYASSGAINCIRDHLLNWQVWPNYADEGVMPQLASFHYVRLPEARALSVPRTGLQIEAILVKHPSGSASQAFLIEAKENYLLYLGDVDLSSLPKVWERIAPLIAAGRCRGIFIDSPALNFYKEGALFGGNEAQGWMEAFQKLAARVNPQSPENALKGLKVIVSHVSEAEVKTLVGPLKPALELVSKNTLELDLIFPKRGEQFDL